MPDQTHSDHFNILITDGILYYIAFQTNYIKNKIIKKNGKLYKKTDTN